MTTKPYGCHNRQPRDGFWVQDGWVAHGCVIPRIEARLMRWHEDRSTPDCQYRKSVPDDPRCVGCEAP